MGGGQLLQQLEAADQKEQVLRSDRARRKEQEELHAVQQQADEDSNEVIKQSIREYLQQSGGDASSEDGGLFRAWLRDFHKEYDDTWFEQNLMRIDLAFRPTFESVMSERSRLLAAKKK